MKVSQIKEICDVEIVGDPNLELNSVRGLSKVTSNSLGFLEANSGTDLSDLPSDCCLVVPSDFAGEFTGTIVRSQTPKFHFALISRHILKQSQPVGWSESASVSEDAVCKASFIGANVVIEDGAEIGESVVLHAGVFVGKNSTIGKGTEVLPEVTIYPESSIGENCVIHAGAKIGAPGFGYVQEGDRIVQFPQIGRVILGNEVEIGANTCIDRGSLDDTFIDDQTKIDNLCQIAHNVRIGKRVRIAAHVGISGSAVIEDDVLIGGQVGIADHVVIRSGAVLGARSAVFPGKIVRKGIWAGTPVRPLDKYKKENSLIRSLERMHEDIKRIKDSD